MNFLSGTEPPKAMEVGPAALALPSEIWNQIFDLASDEDVIFQYGLPTVMAESAWFKNPFGEWTLRSPQEAINLVQRRAYFTKKVYFLLVCCD